MQRRVLHAATRAGVGATIGLALGAALKLTLALAMIGIFVVVRYFLKDSSLRVTVNRHRRKGRQTHGNVFSTFEVWRAVAHPLSGIDYNRLATGDFIHRFTRLDLKLTPQNDGVLVELRRLSRLAPARWAGHLGDADSGCF